MMFDISDLPPPGDAFEWVRAGDVPALVCRPLLAHARHFFTTAHWALPPSESSGWDGVAGALDVHPSRLVHVRQVHGSSVFVVGRDTGFHQAVEADIIVAPRTPDPIGLAVRAADCVPLLMADRRNGAVAAAHAGWRGLAAGVPSLTVAALAGEFGSHASDLVAAIGPSIGACCYEVGNDVRERFGAGFGAERTGRWFQDERARSLQNPPMLGMAETRRAGRWFFDAWAAARDQLLDAGLGGDRIFEARLCTASHPGVFSSYRRDGAAAGRLVGVIRSPIK